MNLYASFSVLGLVAVLLASGCVSDWVQTPPAELHVFNQTTTQNTQPPSLMITNITTDKSLYRSAETLNISLKIYSDTDATNASITAAGINGRLKLTKKMDLLVGENEVSFIYKLPKCNVCGGIREGNYELTCGVKLGNISVINTTSIEIRQ